MHNNDTNDNRPPRLNLPPADLRLLREDGHLKVFDSLRHKYVVLTPEEYVRQHFVAWMTSALRYPESLMANEVGIELNGTRRRCDTVVFRQDSTPLMIIEYKAPGIEITQDVFDQIVRYNMVLKARYLVVSNGIRHYCCRIDYENDTYHFIPGVPDYMKLNWTPNIN